MWESIKEGFRLTHRNWQLVVIHIITAIINFVGMIIFIGTPLIIGIAYLGFDIAHMRDLLTELLNTPADFVARYIGLVLFFIIAALFYLVFASIIYLYTLSGTLGVLGVSSIDHTYTFRLSSFFAEAKRHFGRIFWLLSFLLLVFTGLIIVFAVFGGIATAAIQGMDTGTPSVQMFFNSFISLFVIVFGSILLYAFLVFMLYSLVISVVEGRGVTDSIRLTYEFLRDNTRTFLYYLIILGIGFVVNLVILSLSAFPVLASLINMFLQSYLSVALWGCLIAFYIKSTRPGPMTVTPDSAGDDSSPHIPPPGGVSL